jgi:hypothetical protein
MNSSKAGDVIIVEVQASNDIQKSEFNNTIQVPVIVTVTRRGFVLE